MYCTILRRKNESDNFLLNLAEQLHDDDAKLIEYLNNQNENRLKFNSNQLEIFIKVFIFVLTLIWIT